MAQSTKDYKQFKFLTGNRDTDKGHVTRLAKSIALNPELLKERPILVNENMEVIDGQHRLAACKMLGIEVWFEVGKGLTAEQAIALNRNQKNWTLADFAKSYANSGNQQYVQFLEMLEEYKVSPSLLMTYLQGSSHKGQTVDFRSGKFEIVDEAAARKYLEQLLDLADYNSQFRTNRVAEACLRVFKSENYDHDRMVKKMQLWGDTSFNPYGKTQDVLRSLETTYNFHQTDKGTVRLF